MSYDTLKARHCCDTHAGCCVRAHNSCVCECSKCVNTRAALLMGETGSPVSPVGQHKSGKE